MSTSTNFLSLPTDLSTLAKNAEAKRNLVKEYFKTYGECE